MNRWAITLAICVSAIVGMSQTSQAGFVQSQFFPGELNQASDNSGEFLFNRAVGATTVDVGDVLITVFNIGTIEDLTGGGGTNNLALNGVEFSGLAAIEVTSKVGGEGIFDYTFAPLSAAAKTAIAGDATLATVSSEINSWATGTMIALYDDNTLNFTRTSPPATNDEIAALAIDGTPVFEIGIPAVPVGNQLFWVADDAFEDIALLGVIPPPGAGGDVDFGLDITANFIPWSFDLVGNLNPLTTTVGTSQFSGSGELKGIGGVNTPLQAFNNIDVVFQPNRIPEPGALVCWAGLLLCGAAYGLYRRGKK